MNDRVERPAPGNGDPGAGAPAAILKQCLERGVAFVDQLHGMIVAALDESIRRLSGDPAPGPDALRLLEDFRRLQHLQAALGRAYREYFIRRFRDVAGARRIPADGDGGPDAADGSSFSLVDDQQLEVSIAIDRLVTRVVDRHGEDLQALTRRFRHLLPAAGVECPLAPDSLCRAFNDALESLEVDTRMRVRCFELLYRILVPEIGAFYTALNQLLIEHGVLPNLRIEQAPRAPARDRPERHPAAPDPDPAESSWSDEVETVAAGDAPAGVPTPIHEQMFMAMQHLLNAHFRQDGAAPSGERLVTLPVTPMLIDTLSTLQHDDTLVAQAGELIRGGLRQQVVGRFAGGDGGAGINRIDDETIEVISMIFDYILDDRSLPDFMKALIGRLQIPVLKVAIIDRGFFSRKSHPARQLLNELSHAGMGWRDESEAAKDRLYQKMETVVRRILEEFGNDIGLFDELLTEFRAFLDEEARSFIEAKTRLLETAQEHERRERLTVRIAESLARLLVDRDLPAGLREFLLNPWREHVIAVMLASGEESAEAKATLAFIDDLLWSLAPGTGAEARTRLLRMLPGLLETLRAGMRAIDYPEADGERIIAALEARHVECLKPARRGGAAPAPDKPPAEAPGTVAETAAGHTPGPAPDDVDRMLDEISHDLDELSALDWEHLSSFDDVHEARSEGDQRAFERMIAEMGLEMHRDEGPRVEDEYTEQVRALEPGTWVEIDDDAGGAVRGKLAWKGDAWSSFSFVNRQYKVVAERPLYVLAGDFRSGRARVIEDVALFDRAVDGVISGIVRIAGAAGR